VRDPIADLGTHPHLTVTPAQLAPWWGVTPPTVISWITNGHPHFGRLPAYHRAGTREWLVLTTDAQAFEARLFHELVE
jgi:hypothetical protein